MTRPRHLHLIHDREPELEADEKVNWGCLLAIGASLLVWAVVIAGVVLLLL